MLRKLFISAFVVVIGIIAVYGALIIYGNVQALTEKEYSIPDISQAEYKIIIENTGNLLYSDDVEDNGRIIILNGYWDLQGKEFVYHNKMFPLDEDIFGPVTVTRRE